MLTTIGNAYPKLIEQPIIPLSENIADYLKEYFALLSHASCDESFKMDSKLADLSLQTILTSIRLIYHNYPGENSSSNRKKEICRELIQSITEHYKNERRAQFYADQLGISLQHLSTTVRQVTGKSVLDTIAYIVIMDAKSKTERDQYDYTRNSLFAELPQRFFLRQVFQTICGNDTIGIQKQITS